MKKYAKWRERNQFSGGGRGSGRERGRGGCDRGGFAWWQRRWEKWRRWSNSWLIEERDGGRQDRAIQEKSWDS